MNLSRPASIALLGVAALVLSTGAASAQGSAYLVSGTGGGTAPEAFSPVGTLWDNDVNNGAGGIAAQGTDPTDASYVRSVDDFVLADSTCISGQFEVTGIRTQMMSNLSTSFSVELWNDDGTGTMPDSFVPFFTATQSSNMSIPMIAGFTSYEVTIPTPGLILDAGTYWIGGFGPTTTAPPPFIDFFAMSAGGPATAAPDSLLYAPAGGIATWTAMGPLVGLPSPVNFAFAIDGQCFEGNLSPVEVPTLSPLGIAGLVALLLAASLFVMARRRRA